MKHGKPLAPRHRFKPHLIVAAVLALILLVGGGTVLYRHIANTQKSPFTPTPAQKKAEADYDLSQKKKAIDQSAKGSQDNSGTGSNSKPNTAVQLTAQNGTSGNVVYITKLYGYASGKCTLTVSNGAKSATFSADIIYQPEYSTCAGFSVPISTLGSGTWSATLQATADNGTTQTQSVDWEVK